MWNDYYAKRLAARKRSIKYAIKIIINVQNRSFSNKSSNHRPRSTYQLSPFVVVPPEEYTRKLRSTRSSLQDAPPSPSWAALARSPTSDESYLKSPTVTSPVRSSLISRELQDSIPSFSVRLSSFREGSSLGSINNILDQNQSKRRLADSPSDHDKFKRVRGDDSSQSQILESHIDSTQERIIENENENVPPKEPENQPEFIDLSEVDLSKVTQMSIKDMFGESLIKQNTLSQSQDGDVENKSTRDTIPQPTSLPKSQSPPETWSEVLPHQLQLEPEYQAQPQIEPELNRETSNHENTPQESPVAAMQEEFEQDMWSIPQLDYGSPEPMNIETEQLENANIGPTIEIPLEDKSIIIDHPTLEEEGSAVQTGTQKPLVEEEGMGVGVDMDMGMDLDMDIEFPTDEASNQPLPDQTIINETQKRNRGRPYMVPMEDILGTQPISSAPTDGPPELDLDTFIKKHTDLLEAAAAERENKEQAVDEIRRISGPVFDEVSMFFKNITDPRRQDLVSRFGSIIVDELEALTILYSEYLKSEWIIRREKYLLKRLRTRLLEIRMKEDKCKNEKAALKRRLEESNSKRATFSGLSQFFDHIQSIRAQVAGPIEQTEEHN
ncbi:hypothetical protein CLU79DRAFT_780545 [Phycomyces nitens]|nr:hypothetical protein CLU79DRAFT_780545 [Phycomyces nitens]